MNISTIILFFVYCYSFGYLSTFYITNKGDSFERHIMRVGIGLGVLSFFLVFLDFVHIPLDWKIHDLEK